MIRPKWSSRRFVPYSAAGIARVTCIRCGVAPAAHSWQACADRRAFRPICLECDAALNELVLRWMGHPDTDFLVSEYRRRLGLEPFGAGG